MPNSLHLNIPTPCHENWQNMQPNQEGRHCMSCRKTVVDFSVMSDREIIDHISNAGTEVCGRFDQHQLNRGLRENGIRRKYGWMYVWNLLIVLFVFGSKAKAQGAVRWSKYQLIQKKLVVKGELAVIIADPQIAGRVVNEETGEPIAFASISATRGGTATDSAGKFSLEVAVEDSATITVSAIGFASQTFILPVAACSKDMTFYLKPEAKVLDEVVVVASDSYCRRMLSGLIATVTHVSITEQITREWLPNKKDIVAYPNPLPAGNTMNVSLQLKESGQYRMELLDAGGRVLWIQQMNIPAQKHKISIPTQPTWSAGIYWLRISGNHTRKVYNSRIVVQ